MRPVNWSSPINWNHPLNRDLVGWWLVVPHWTGGTVLRDLLGLNHGILDGMAPASDWVGPTDRPGGMGALDFDGTDDFVDLGASSRFDPLLRSMAVMYWIKSSDTAVTIRTVQKRGTGGFGAQAGWQISRQGGDSPWRNTGWDDGTNAVSIDSGIGDSGNLDDVMDGEWHHMCLMWDAAAESILGFVDGIQGTLTTTTTGAVGSISVARNTTIASSWNDASTQTQHMEGQIDDLRIYMRLLASQEVSDYYQLSRQSYPGLLNRRSMRVTVPAVAAITVPEMLAATQTQIQYIEQRLPAAVGF